VPTRSDHVDLLATKWLKSAELAELVKTDGLQYKKGKFSEEEQLSLREAIARYQEVCESIKHGFCNALFRSL
jgi:hypothetical protein